MSQKQGWGGGKPTRGGWSCNRQGQGGWRGSSYRGGGKGRGRPTSWNRVPGGNNARSSRPLGVPSRQLVSDVDTFLPYKGWRLYFPDEVYSFASPTVSKVKIFERFFKQRLPSFDKDGIERNGCICIGYQELLQDEAVKNGLPDLGIELRDMPEKIISCLGLAIHQVLTEDLEGQAAVLQHQSNTDGDIEGSVLKPPSIIVSLPIIHARILHYEPVTQLKNIKASYCGRFSAVKGTVVRVGNIKPICTRMAFQCNHCGDVQVLTLPDGRYTLPTKCLVTECKGRSFTPKRSSPLTETVDWQMIKVQEMMTDDRREAGRIPRTIECELVNDLVDSCIPGDNVTINGVIKVSDAVERTGRHSKDKCMFLLYLHANSVTNTKSTKKSLAGVTASSSSSSDFTIKELYAIQEIQAQDDLFKLIVGSLCPAIYGHEMVKAGLLLGLFGGTQKFVNDKNRIPVRGNSHILVVGDPGLGKSQMLKAVANVAPRGVYVCGNTTSATGLTVTLSKESGTGDYALEAGALVLADQGCCCIDEFDKMSSQHQALLEAMEQQSISLAKAGIVCNLPARAAILAAANPVGGHYNKAKTVSENLKMGSALLSRFDLVFILVDKPDEQMDSMLSEHVMAMHAGRKRFSDGEWKTQQRTVNNNDDEAKRLYEAERLLSERLKYMRGETLDPIPVFLLRKYIAYARKYVHPKLSQDAATVLQNFYLELRKQHNGIDSIPITTRQLESLVRLAEARARLELREKVTGQDAADVVEMMKYSMIDTFSDEFGFMDFARSQHGSGMSTKSQAKKFIAVMNKLAERTCNNTFTVQQMRTLAKETNINVPDFENFISSLNNQNFLLKKGPRLYQLQTSNF
ncbi:DNA helicase MCM8-like [Anneissia japonica]|uniref:DNA helicase MCM8-like n=1 Tax=Anneissia japonica TaxID=1529436 RepID=UPI0014255FAE|nr:DNA helicase MCM8-like [Anneissia japonica]